MVSGRSRSRRRWQAAGRRHPFRRHPDAAYDDRPCWSRRAADRRRTRPGRGCWIGRRIGERRRVSSDVVLARPSPLAGKITKATGFCPLMSSSTGTAAACETAGWRSTPREAVALLPQDILLALQRVPLRRAAIEVSQQRTTDWRGLAGRQQLRAVAGGIEAARRACIDQHHRRRRLLRRPHQPSRPACVHPAAAARSRWRSGQAQSPTFDSA